MNLFIGNIGASFYLRRYFLYSCRTVFVTGLVFIIFMLAANKVFAQVPPKQWKQEMIEHRERVLVLGEGTFLAHKDRFPNLNIDLVRSFLSLHDLPKIQEVEDLRKWGYAEHRDKTLYERFCEFAGMKMSELQGRDLFKAQSAVLTLNVIEDKQLDVFLRNNRLDRGGQTVKSLSLLARAVDVSDTGISRRVEMGIKGARKYDGTRFLEAKGEYEAALLSAWIEDNYNGLLKRGKSRRCELSLK